MSEVTDILHSTSILGIDTAPFIYYIEEHPVYFHRVAPFFAAAGNGEIQLVTSAITVSEVLIQPLRLGVKRLHNEYLDLFLHSENLQIQSVDIEVAQKSAQLRAIYNLRLPDALQIAAALYAGCTMFLTNDRKLARTHELRILVVDDLE